MGCGCSKKSKVVPEKYIENREKQEKDLKKKQRKNDKKWKQPDYDALSMASVATGKSLVFPDHNSVEALACTPSNKGRFVRMEDTFWSKKRKLIPDYSVMERIDAHVVKVRIITNKIMQKSYNHVIVKCNKFA